MHDLRRHWIEHGPPTHVAVALFASAWGVKLTSDAPERDETAELAPNLPTIAELMAAATMPGAGGDTTAATRAVLQRLGRTDG